MGPFLEVGATGGGAIGTGTAVTCTPCWYAITYDYFKITSLQSCFMNDILSNKLKVWIVPRVLSLLKWFGSSTTENIINALSRSRSRDLEESSGVFEGITFFFLSVP